VQWQAWWNAANNPTVAAADQAESAEPLAGALGGGAAEVTGGAKTAGSAAVGAAAAAIVFSLCPQQK